MSRKPTADELYNDTITKRERDAALAEARELSRWAGRRIPNGPTSGFMTQGYVIGHTGDLDLAVAMIVARVRAEAVGDFITRNSVSHVARIKPGVMVAGSLMKDDDYSTQVHRDLMMAPESRRARNARQLAVRKTGKCDSCGAEFVEDLSAQMSGPAKRTRKQWRGAFKVSKTRIPSGLVPTYSMGRFAAATEKIPNHNESPTGEHRRPLKGKRK